MTTLRLATRKSKLALAQARAWAKALCAQHPGLEIEEVHIVTSGDRFKDQPLQDIGGKGLFLKEIEEALIDGSADIAVHSIKDVPADLAPNLVMAAIPEREDPRDALVLNGATSLEDLKHGARIGTSSLRRRTLLLAQRPDLNIGPLRGNVDTRLRKLDEKLIDGIVLAYAGLRRLGLQDRATQVLDPSISLPAIGQGALGIECRADDDKTRELLAVTDDRETRIRVTAERAFMAAVEGNCHMPVAAFAEKRGDQMFLRAMLAEEDGSDARFAEATCTFSEKEGIEAGRALGSRLKQRSK